MRPNLYGLTLAIAILAGLLVAKKLAPKFKFAPKVIEDAFPWVVIFGILGARLYYVGFSWNYFGLHPQDILAIWKGGLSIYGAIMGGTLGALIFARRNHLRVLTLLDLIAVVAPFGQSLGRWGNFFNEEAFGRPTSRPWGLYISPQNRPREYLSVEFFHPTFLYESLWDLAVFLILLYLLGRAAASRPPAGFLVGVYLVLYAGGRFLIESLRLDSFFWGTVRVDQAVSLIAVLIAAVILYLTYRTHEKPRVENQ